MTNKIQIGILEDHVATAMGLKAHLNANPKLNVAWMAQYFEDLEGRLETYHTDILLLDVGLPKNPEENDPYPIFHVIPRLLEIYPEIKIMVISMHNRPALFKAIKSAGASGYILKHDVDSFNRLDEILLDVYEHDSIYYSLEILEVLSNPDEKPALTRRQNEILSLISSQPGISNVELADMLYVAPSTVRNHLSDIYLKLGVNNRAAAIIKAQQLGLLTGGVEDLSIDSDEQS